MVIKLLFLSFTDGGIVEDKEDLFSETSSVTSQGEQLFFRHSKKHRRKAEKKKYSLKEGSQYEDVALLSALGDIVSNITNMQSLLV